MNKEIKAKWVAALRSGEYKQGLGQLRSKENNFCCLGVLCNLHAQAHPEIAAQQTDPGMYLGAKSFPDHKVINWAGLGSINPDVIYKKKPTNLSALNDGIRIGEPLSFKQIASIIEKQL